MKSILFNLYLRSINARCTLRQIDDIPDTAIHVYNYYLRASKKLIRHSKYYLDQNNIYRVANYSNDITSISLMIYK